MDTRVDGFGETTCIPNQPMGVVVDGPLDLLCQADYDGLMRLAFPSIKNSKGLMPVTYLKEVVELSKKRYIFIYAKPTKRSVNYW